MPHKHTRRTKDPATLDLPPSQVAKPLPATTISKKDGAKGNAKARARSETRKRKRNDAKDDDAPRAFKRLMSMVGGKKPRPGLDNGEADNKNKKSPKARSHGVDSIPKIRPGEKLSEFSSRVNAALPVSGLVNKSANKGGDPLGLKVWRTRKEMKMHKLYEQWREEERKIKERREEELELEAERELENEALGVTWRLDMESAASAKKKKKKGASRTKSAGEEADKDDDPWEELKRKRGEGKIGLHDVASAPPDLKPIQQKFTVRGATVDVHDIPKVAGSLRRREELQGVREEVVASYRKMMEKKRSGRARGES
ncbi:hypothetical protein VTK73DRAFT_509 [Phialemonium thermophilum]|uniref:Urease accessory protein UreD n=1 Tax=Phialemonium thermophilum TaxID=223376 RepID=A0ABR3Y5A4_9PEZI